LVTTLSAFVACSSFAGTSELFGAYLAGAFLSHVLSPPPSPSNILPDHTLLPTPLPLGILSVKPTISTPHTAFTTYLLPSLLTIFAPIFFASIGMALPIRSLVTVNGSHAVVWRGVVYAGMMVLAKALVGLWMLVWPEGGWRRAWQVGRRMKGRGTADMAATEKILGPTGPNVTMPTNSTRSNSPEISIATDARPQLSRPRSALLLGLAMVARGEIALIIAQLARPLFLGLTDGSQDTVNGDTAFAIIIWAILVTTFVGAIGVGWILQRK